jgi:uncharacterized protein (TIGR02246 family)
MRRSRAPQPVVPPAPREERNPSRLLEPCRPEDGACIPAVKPDAATETELIEVLERFCSAFADRDREAVMRLIAPDPGVVVVTSEEPLLRGRVELARFLHRYVDGPTTYSWEWDRHDVSTGGSVAWLLAEGTETAATEDRLERHPYRMTMVLERREDRWLVRQVHGSSPH